MWAIRLQTLKLLTKLISANIRFKWTSVEQEAFDEVKQIVAKEVLLVCPNLKKRFYIHTDAIDYKLGTVISQ